MNYRCYLEMQEVFLEKNATRILKNIDLLEGSVAHRRGDVPEILFGGNERGRTIMGGLVLFRENSTWFSFKLKIPHMME